LAAFAEVIIILLSRKTIFAAGIDREPSRTSGVLMKLGLAREKFPIFNYVMGRITKIGRRNLMPESEFLLGAFVYRRKLPKPGSDVKPVFARVQARTPHLARRFLAVNLLQRGFFIKEIRVLTDYLEPYDEEEWEIQ